MRVLSEAPHTPSALPRRLGRRCSARRWIFWAACQSGSAQGTHAMNNPPGMSTLSDPREITFVTILLDLGGAHYAAEAAKRAGYAETEADADYAAALLLSHPRIAKAITGEVKRRFDIATASAINTLLEVCVNSRAPANARISAAQEILNRSSIGPVISRTASANLNVGTGIEALLEKLDAAQEEELTIDVMCNDPG
jgi:hypothetical protein